MGEQLTLAADLDGASLPDLAVPAGYRLRTATRADADAVGRLYFEAYDPGIACDSVEEAVADTVASFDGDYGPLLDTASLVAETDDGEPAGAILTVHRAPWDDVPDCPFVIELFTARAHRRRGVGRSLVVAALHAITASGEPAVALRVDAANRPATALYGELGFTRRG